MAIQNARVNTKQAFRLYDGGLYTLSSTRPDPTKLCDKNGIPKKVTSGWEHNITNDVLKLAKQQTSREKNKDWKKDMLYLEAYNAARMRSIGLNGEPNYKFTFQIYKNLCKSDFGILNTNDRRCKFRTPTNRLTVHPTCRVQPPVRALPTVGKGLRLSETVFSCRSELFRNTNETLDVCVLCNKQTGNTVNMKCNLCERSCHALCAKITANSDVYSCGQLIINRWVEDKVRSESLCLICGLVCSGSSKVFCVFDDCSHGAHSSCISCHDIVEGKHIDRNNFNCNNVKYQFSVDDIMKLRSSADRDRSTWNNQTSVNDFSSESRTKYIRRSLRYTRRVNHGNSRGSISVNNSENTVRLITNNEDGAIQVPVNSGTSEREECNMNRGITGQVGLGQHNYNTRKRKMMRNLSRERHSNMDCGSKRPVQHNYNTRKRKMDLSGERAQIGRHSDMDGGINNMGERAELGRNSNMDGGITRQVRTGLHNYNTRKRKSDLLKEPTEIGQYSCNRRNRKRDTVMVMNENVGQVSKRRKLFKNKVIEEAQGIGMNKSLNLRRKLIFTGSRVARKELDKDLSKNLNESHYALGPRCETSSSLRSMDLALYINKLRRSAKIYPSKYSQRRKRYLNSLHFCGKCKRSFDLSVVDHIELNCRDSIHNSPRSSKPVGRKRFKYDWYLDVIVEFSRYESSNFKIP